MPYKSKAQAAFLHAHPEKVGGEAALKEWDAATDFKHLPEHKNMDAVTHGLASAAKKHQHPKRTKHGIKRITIENADDGSHTIKHEKDDGTMIHHTAPDVDGLKQNLDSM